MKRNKRTIIDEREEYERVAALETEAPDTENLSAEELSMLRTAARQSVQERGDLPYHDNSEAAQVKRVIKQNKAFSAVTAFVVVGLIALVVLGIVLLVAFFGNRPNRSDFTVYLGDEEPYTVPYNQCVRDGVLYVDLRRIAKQVDLTVSGSGNKLRFTGSDNNYVQFEKGETTAVINGETVEITSPLLGRKKETVCQAYIENGTCLIPYRFLTRALSQGILFHLNEETNTVKIKRNTVTEMQGRDQVEVPVNILFHTAPFTVIPPETAPPKYEYFYIIDIAPYLDAITSEELLLANKRNPLGEEFKPDIDNLKETYNIRTDAEKQYLQPVAAQALKAMLSEMEADGITDVFVTSSYRSFVTQNWLYYSHYYDQEKTRHPDWSDEQIYAEISTYSSRPGESEHQTGLCVDFQTSSMKELDNSFEESDAFRWLEQNAYKFGFILRYPKDKIAVTEYSYESWHFRFVGRDAASDIHFEDLCLEEYLDRLAQENKQ